MLRKYTEWNEGGFGYGFHTRTMQEPKKFFLLVELRLFFVVQIEITNLKHNFFIMWFSLLNYIELVLIKDVWCHIKNIS